MIDIAGRKGIYDEKIKSRFKDIEKWARKGVTEKAIAKNLGVSYSTFNKYKVEKIELSDLLKKSRLVAVEEIENAMYECAIGGKQVVKKYAKCKKIKYENGKKISEEEVMESYDEEVYIPPNTTAAIYLLKHWGKSQGYTNDPLTLDLKKEELKFKKKKAEEDSW